MGVVRSLHVATRHRRGGAERNLIHTVERELERGWNVHVAVSPDEFVHSLPGDTRVHFIPDLQREVSPMSDLRAAVALRRLARAHEFDLIHTHQSKAGIIGRLAAKDQQGLLVHTIHMPSFGEAYEVVASSIFRECERLCSRFTDYFVAVGPHLRQMYLSAGVGRGKNFRVIESPIEISRFSSLREISCSRQDEWRQQFQIPARAQVLMSIGALDRRKRHDLVIMGLSSLLERTGSVLLIAGEGPERATLERTVTEYASASSVRLLGFVDNIEPLLGIANVLVHLADAEGVPQVVLQAQAAGVQVAARDSPALRDLPSVGVVPVDRECTSLPHVVDELLGKGGQIPDLDVFEPWKSAAVAGKLSDFHDELEARIGAGR